MAGQMAKKIWNESGYPGLPASLRKDDDDADVAPASAPASKAYRGNKSRDEEVARLDRTMASASVSSSLPLAESCGARKQVTEAPLVTHPLTELTVMEDPVGHGDARVYHGRDAIMEKFGKIWAVRAPVMVCTGAFSCGSNSVAAHFTMSMQSKSSGRVTFPVFQVFELNGKRISSTKTYWDRVKLSEKLQ